MKHWMIIGLLLAVAAAFQAGRSSAQTQMAPQIGYHAVGQAEAVLPPLSDMMPGPLTDTVDYLQKQSQLQAELGLRAAELRKDPAVLERLGSEERRNLWRRQCDRIAERAAGLRDALSDLALWAWRQAA